MKVTLPRPQSAITRSQPRESSPPFPDLQESSDPIQPEPSAPHWGSLFRPKSAASHRSFLSSTLRQPLKKETIVLKPGTRYEMGMFSSPSQKALRQHFKPKAKINAYAMYVSAASATADASQAITMSPQPYTEAELNGIRKAPSVDKMLRAAKLRQKHERDLTVRKAKVNSQKVPLLDCEMYVDTESDEEREKEAVRVMENLHLKFRKLDRQEAERGPQRPSVTLSSADSMSIDPSPRLTEPDDHYDLSPSRSSLSSRPQTAHLFKYDSRSSIPEADEDRIPTVETLSSARTVVPRFQLFESSGEVHPDSLIPTLRTRPMSASLNKKKPAQRPRSFQTWKLSDTTLSPFGTRMKGGKVRDCAKYGIMFRPATSEADRSWSFLPPSVVTRNPSILSKKP